MYVQASMELRPEDVSLLERCPHFRGYTPNLVCPPQVQVCDLVLTNEGQRLINYVKVIDNYFNVLGNLEGSIRLPHQPIEIGVAADTHR